MQTKDSVLARVSIITVSFNSAATIRDTIESVLSQDYPNVEYILIDGGSTDGTMDIVREYAGRIAAVVSELDKGIYDAMNKGIRLATGDIVGMINSDDMFASPASIRRLVSHLMSTRSDCVFADLVMVDPKNTARVTRYFDSARFRPYKLRFGWMPAHPTFMAKRSVYEKHGLFSLDYRIAADFEMMVRLFHREHLSYAHLPSVEVKMRAGGASTAGWRSHWIVNNEMVRACRKNGLFTVLPLMLIKVPAKLLEYIRLPKKI